MGLNFACDCETVIAQVLLVAYLFSVYFLHLHGPFVLHTDFDWLGRCKPYINIGSSFIMEHISKIKDDHTKDHIVSHGYTSSSTVCGVFLCMY